MQKQSANNNSVTSSFVPEWHLNLGAKTQNDGSVSFNVWAPKAKSLSLVLMKNGKETYISMHPEKNEYFQIDLPDLSQGIDYKYSIDGGIGFPDPASRWQPNGVHGPSRVHNPNEFTWHDQNWKGIDIKDYLIYELHIGTFTPQGTFEAIIEKIPHLQQLGITAIELMPVIEFPGNRNWGYDGVYPFAPHHGYGGPAGLKRLIDSCHQAGIAVIIDVVYNHLGPEGNYLGQFGHYFSDKYKTPWGDAVNFDSAYCDDVRRYFIDNALYWLTEYHADALRLDAIQMIYDFSASHILKDLREAFHKQAENLGRKAYVIAESDLNDVRIVNPVEIGGYNIDAQWSDDFHHALHALLTGSKQDYFADYGKVSQFVKSVTDGFIYNGQWSEFRKRTFGSSSDKLPGHKFVINLQNHDQVGNAGRGRRIGTMIDENKYRLGAMLLILAPNIPFLFMGQEWNASSPFFFFTSYEDKKLVESVREGYKKEFNLGEDESLDPQDPERFEQTKLKWDELENPKYGKMFEFYKKLISLRKELKCLSNCRKDLIQAQYNEDDKWFAIHRSDPSGSEALLIANFLERAQNANVIFPRGKWSLRLNSNQEEMTNNIVVAVEENHLQSISINALTALLFVKI